MRKGRLFTYLLTGILLLVLIFGWEKEQEGDRWLYAEIPYQGSVETVRFWKADGSSAFLFIPSGVSLDQIRLRTFSNSDYQIGDIPVTDGMYCDVFETDMEYMLTYSKNAGIHSKHLYFVQSENVDTMFLDVSSGNMDYLHRKKSNSETGSVRLYSPEGKQLYTGKADKISGRGQSTWEAEKKSYNVTLNQEADLLGMGSAANWVLLSNSQDATNLRNKLILDFAQQLGLSYTPDSRWVDLYLNGEYAGVYLLCEKNEIHPQRVAISQEGSILVNKDWEWRFQQQGNPYIVTRDNTALRIRYADMDNSSVLNIFQSVENAILAEDGIDPVTGKSWLELIDLDSWARKYLLEEVFSNTDGASLSQFYYLDGSRQDGKIYAGPAWDYDLTMNGDANRIRVNLQGLYGSAWMWALNQKAEFQQAVVKIYTSEFAPLLGAFLDSTLDSYIQYIAQASKLNDIRWYGIDTRWQVDVIPAFLQHRKELFDRMWTEGKPYQIVQVETLDHHTVAWYVEPGDTLPDWFDNNSQGVIWCHAESLEPVNMDAEIWQDLMLVPVIQTEDPPLQENPEQETEPEEGFSLIRIMPSVLFLTLLVLLLACERVRSGTGAAPSGTGIAKAANCGSEK
ncbi:MAG: CotH kinase family protein [Oscillospiraceae bacterium]|nr:CotH kinase family protein [Oscillospiraceae bacterium]